MALIAAHHGYNAAAVQSVSAAAICCPSSSTSPSWYLLLSRPPPPPPHAPTPRFSAAPSLINLTVSVDVKHYVYFIIPHGTDSLSHWTRPGIWVAGCRPRRRLNTSRPLGSPVAVTQSVSARPGTETFHQHGFYWLYRCLCDLWFHSLGSCSGEGTDFFLSKT